MTVAPQVAMRKASQMWQVFFPSQTLHVFFFLSQNLQIFGLALRKKAQYVVVEEGMILGRFIFVHVLNACANL
jgi:hypothetical protein